MTILNDQDAQAVVLAMMNGAHGEAVLETDLLKAIEWAQNTVLDWELFKMVVNGKLHLSIAKDDGDVVFHSIPGIPL